MYYLLSLAFCKALPHRFLQIVGPETAMFGALGGSDIMAVSEFSGAAF